MNGWIELEKKEMRIETERLIIRPFREEDADALYRIKTDPRVMEYCPDFLDVDAQRAGMQDYIRAFQKMEETGDTDTWRCYAIESRETGEVMGALTRPENRKAVIETENPPIQPLTDEDCSRLFDRFYRADKARDREKQNGYGIGLSIAQAVITRHGGTASAGMTPDGTLLIRLTIPLDK